jgi:exodeoxyribonuclease VII large subunit
MGLLFPAEQRAEEPGHEPRRIWSVGALVAQIRGHVERAYPDCWVEGEISGLRAAGSGHIYFTLKDEAGQLPVVLFRRQASLLRFRPESALHVLVRGRVSIYEERGQIQLIAETMEPIGAGSLQLAFEQLKRRLEEEGLFAAGRKRPLPPFPRCIGIVTSAAGAVIHDFLNIAGRRHAGLDVTLYPAAVQGEQAAAEVAAGIAYFNRAGGVDAIVLARGGGSLEDLAAFNSEMVARAIAASKLPVVSAIGHETDFTIADFVADLRAPTPSAAAELLTAHHHGVEERIGELELRLLRACRYSLALAGRRFASLSPQSMEGLLRRRLERAEQRLDEQQLRLAGGIRALLRRGAEALERLEGRLMRQSGFRVLASRRERWSALDRRLEALSPGLRCTVLRQAVGHLESRAELAARAALSRTGARLKSAEGRLLALSPLAVLERGYSLTFDAAGRLLRDTTSLRPGEAMRTRLARGIVTSEVTQIEDPL